MSSDDAFARWSAKLNGHMVKLRQTSMPANPAVDGGKGGALAGLVSSWTELTCYYSLFSLIRLPAWDTLLRAHSTPACRTCSPTPGLQSLTQLRRRWPPSCPCHMGYLPPCWILHVIPQ